MNEATTTNGAAPISAMLISLSFTFGRQGGEDKALTAELCEKYGSSKKAVKGTKLVLCKEAMAPLKTMASEFRGRLARITTKWDVDGVYLCKPSNVAKVMALRDEYFPQLQLLKAGHLLERYEGWKALTREQLQGTYKEEEFPTLEQLQEIEWGLTIMPLPESDALRRIKDIDDTLMEELTKSHSERVQKGIKEGMATAYSRLMAPMQHMVDTLSKEGPKIHETLCENVRKVIAEIPGLNLTDDSDLMAFAKKAEELLATISSDILREDPVIRQSTADKAKAILETFAAPGFRKFSLP